MAASAPAACTGGLGQRVWRILTVCAVAGILVATHWPRLRLSEEAPSDKVLHATTYAVLALLVARACWLRHSWQVLLAVVAFASLDEATQSLPPFHRHTSLNDWIADLVGIGLFMLLSAGVPLHVRAGPRSAGTLHADADREFFDRPFGWIALATSVVLGAMVGALVALAGRALLQVDAHSLQSLFLCAVLGGWCGGVMCWRSGVGALARQLGAAKAGLAHAGNDQVAAPVQRLVSWRHAAAGLLRSARAAVAAFATVAIVAALGWSLLALVGWSGAGEPLADPSMRTLFAIALAVAWAGLTLRWNAQ